MIDIMDLHTHTIASGHAYNTLFEMAQAAAAKGLQVFGVTEHGPNMDGSCCPTYFGNFKVIPRDLFGLKLMMGCELNILNSKGHVDLTPDRLRCLDHGIASIHPVCYEHSDRKNVAQNTDAYVNAIQNPYVQIIGHPDDGRIPFDFDTVAAAAREHHVLLEVNSSSLNPRSVRKNAKENYLKLLERCVHYGTSIIIGSDAHIITDVGNHKAAHQLLEEIAFPEELIVNTSLDKLAAFIPSLNKASCGGHL